MYDKEEGFTIENYGRKSVFASFLPGISGRKGIPVWSFYVNRGQGIASFGVEDKDHAIMEFYPAHQAYQNVKLTGFRTFLLVDGKYVEPFSDEEVPHSMNIYMNAMEIEENNKDEGIHTSVLYYVLPQEEVGGLVRKVTLCNCSSKEKHIEMLDGMPALIPYGIDMKSLKEIGQTVKAWMQVEEAGSIPYFRTRASIADTAAVTKVMGGNFSYGVTDRGEHLKAIVHPDMVFSYDMSLQEAKGFKKKGLDSIHHEKQSLFNQYPCCFYGVKETLMPGEKITIYELYGQVSNKEILNDFLSEKPMASYFAQKAMCARKLTEEMCQVISTKTGHPSFDRYCSYTYMDNVLRGGYPILLPGKKVFYIYSRKHGDLERDYNYFKVLPEYYSQGNGNFRDVNQNRRMDNFFTAYVEEENITKFYNMLQLDGYNPLCVEKITYKLKEEDAVTICDLASQEQKEELIPYLTGEFTPGGLYRKMKEVGISKEIQDSYFNHAIEKASDNMNVEFGEGYWSDHWTYNLDLVESYLSIFPEKEQYLLFSEKYTYYCSQIPLLPRNKRYVKTESGIRQYHFLDEEKKRTKGEKVVRENFGKGEPLKVTLMEKLLMLCATKYAALDVYGMGVEMDGGKPGWYDALNGLPALFGSSMAETYELARLMEYTVKLLDKYIRKISLTEEVIGLLQSMDNITILHIEEIEKDEELLEFWDKRCKAKEKYQQNTFQGISGKKVLIETTKVAEIVKRLLHALQCGIRKALSLSDDICPTYFTYEVKDFLESEEGILPKSFQISKVPYFLEGPVKYLKLDITREEKKKLYISIKKSDLYDRTLHMYKVNASLENASYEYGRAKVFTPGWLENESIWLHMEYKYFLELLKSGMYEEFARDFKNAAIPFLEPDIYGRSIYENSSFIASSKNPDRHCHGKGFVARLSGSTVEFLHIWKLMMFGKDTFRFCEGELLLSLQPVLPKYLIGTEKKIEAMFLGKTQVTYFLDKQSDYFPGEYCIEKIKLYYFDGSNYQTKNTELHETVAKDIRNGRVERMEVWIHSDGKEGILK